MRVLILLLLVVLLPASAMASAIRAEVAGSARLTDYNPFASTPARGTVDIVLFNDNTTAAEISLVLLCETTPCRLRSGKDKLRFELDSQTMWIPKKGAILASVSLTLPPQSQQRLPVSFLVPALQVRPQGLYQARIELLQGSNQNGQALGSFIVETTVGQHADISLSSEGKGQFDNSLSLLALGDVQANKAANAFLNLRSNAPVRIEMVSEYNGALRHTDDAGLPSIPYTLKLDGKTLVAGKPMALDRKIPLNASGISVPMRVMFQSTPRNLMAGLYRDYVTISVVPF